MNDNFNAVEVVVVANSDNPHGVAMTSMDGGVPMAVNDKDGQTGVVTPAGTIYVCP